MSNRIELENQLDETKKLLGLIAKEGLPEITSWEEIANIVRQGEAESVFSIGDQLVTSWIDPKTGTEYKEVPMDVVAFRDVTLEDGETVPGMFLQWHYCVPNGVQFDANEALYYAESGLTAGTYYFSFGSTVGKAVSGKSYQFTLTKDVPAKGHVCINQGYWDSEPSSWKISTYSDGASSTAIETVSLSEGTSGTSLGTSSTSIKSTDSSLINNMQRYGYGYNRWSQSALRQFLNSSEAKGSWWTSQNNFDRFPAELSTFAGFMTGFSEDFLSVLKKVKVTTFKNTISDDGKEDVTYDTFFVPSLQECYCNPQIKGEGEYYPYWKQKAGLTSPCAQGGTYAQMRTFAIENHTSAQTVRLRSAYTGYAFYAWFIHSSGCIHNYGYNATYSLRFSPVCVIA